MKQTKISISYDKDGDYLEVNLKKCKETYFDEKEKNFAEIKDTKTHQIVGYAIFNFLKQNKRELSLAIPSTEER